MTTKPAKQFYPTADEVSMAEGTLLVALVSETDARRIEAIQELLRLIPVYRATCLDAEGQPIFAKPQ